MQLWQTSDSANSQVVARGSVECLGLVVELVGVEAVVQLADQSVEQVA
jgi:hypothetical protein